MHTVITRRRTVAATASMLANVSPQVVQIESNQGLGSGIVYDDRGAIVTNAHVAGHLTPVPGDPRRR